MTSINTNIAAQTALRTLQSTNMQLDQTQSRISTGLKIAEAKDNAAYWSISTSLKSDNKAMGTVKDALGLGAATVDTAYAGLNNTLNVLNEIKSKVTAATQNGVNKDALQAEINELQKQLQSVATSSTFSSENWLSVDSSASGYTANRSVVASFVRDTAGGVSIGTIDIDISSIALFDTNPAGEGILNGGKEGNATKVGQITSGVGSGMVNAAAQGAISTYAIAGTFVANQNLSVDVTIDNGRTQTISFNSGATAEAAGAALDAALETAFGGLVTVTNATGTVTVNTASKSAASRITFGALTQVGGGATTTTGTATATQTGSNATYTAATLNFGNFVAANDSFKLDSDDSISFQVAVNGKEAQTVTIRKATVDKALGSTDGKVNDIDSMRLVLSQALADAKVTGLTVADNGTRIALTSTDTTVASKIDVFGAAASKGTSVESINVVGASSVALADYISTINNAIDRVTSAASNLGAVASRIELQQGFVSTLMDTIDQGISGLIDADMNEESTRLQALQVKQQLGVQALSIANQSAQNVLSLFR